ncbi:MAG TPA: serine/threonine-protein kinase [Polyangia bacterium]
MGKNGKTPSVEAILRPGQILDHKYRVEKLIGLGGMAAVWVGVNKRTGKRVVLKMILQSLADSEVARERFRREALAAGLINHPNVVTVFDIFEHEGRDCIVMELLLGEPFSDRLARQGLMEPEEAFALLLPALRGVAAAHAHHVIHRDLKPHNIFLCTSPDGQYVTTKVLDFGISKIMQPAGEASELTVAGKAMGTPAYMAPELASGSRTLDRRTDVYGFGAVLYEALSGHRPFQGQEGVGLLNSIITQPPRPIASFRPDLSPEVVAVVERAMAKEPSNRYRSVESLIGAIEFLLPATTVPRAFTPIVGVPAIPAADMLRRLGETANPRPSRTPWIVTGAALAVSTMLAMWAVYTLFRR